MEMANGQNFTVPTAVYLTEQYRDSALKVFYDHGGKDSQHIHSWFGPVYAAPKRDKILSWIDIVIADPTSGKVHKIIEIEDSTAGCWHTIVSDDAQCSDLPHYFGDVQRYRRTKA